MIVPDTNLLLYATFETFAQHGAARRWWEELLNSQEEVGLTAPAVFGFVRIGTHRRIFATPLELDDAVSRVEEWLPRPNARWLVPGPRHLEIAFRLLRIVGSAANLTTDAQLAAHAIENQAELHSTDLDFARFAGLRWRNPLDR